MQSVRKIAVGLVLAIGVIALLLVSATILIPLLVDRTELGNKVRSEVSARIGGDVTFSNVSLSFFPLPHAVLANPHISIKDELSASAEIIEVYPELFRLLTGHVALKRAMVDQPKVTVRLAASGDATRDQSSPADSIQLSATILQPLSRLTSLSLPVANGTISQGSIKLVSGQATVVTIDHLDAELQKESDVITLKATAASDVIEEISATGTISLGKPDATLHLVLGGVKLGALCNGFVPEASTKIASGEAAIEIDIARATSESMAATFKASAQKLRLVRAKQAVDIAVQSLSGKMRVDGASATFTLSGLTLNQPAMSITGSFSQSEKEPHLRVDLEGRDIDVDATRSTALVLVGSDSLAQTIFDIVNGGTIPMLSLSAQANTFSGLADLDNLALKTALASGEITIPGANLIVTGVSGDVDLTKGILSGSQLMGTWMKSRVKDGMVIIDLTKDPLPLHAETAIDADAADMPPLLAHFIDDKTFKDELAQIKDLEGSGTAALVITGDTDQVQVDVSATGIQLSADYRRLPFPLQITDGGVSYDGSKVAWTRLGGSVGTASFSSLSGSLDFTEQKTVSITSGTSHIVMADLVPWFLSRKTTRNLAGHYGAGKGLLHVSGLQAHGSLQDLEKLQFSVAGELEDLTIQSLPMQPGPLKISALTFSADHETASFSGVHLAMLDASLNVSGAYRNYMADNKELSLSVAGQLGPRLVARVAEQAHIPSQLKLRPLSIRKGDLTFSANDTHTITAAFALQHDLEVSTTIRFMPDGVEVRSLAVKDSRSGATLSGRKKARLLDVSFEGTLHESSISQITQIDMKTDGKLEGKAKINLNLDSLQAFSLTGQLKAEKLLLPLLHDAPLLINTLALSGRPDGITITSGILSWLDSLVDLTGSVKMKDSGPPLVSLDVDADRIDVDAILKHFGSTRQADDDTTASRPFSLPITGDVRFKTKRLEIQQRSIEPLQADLHLANNTVDIQLKEATVCGVPLEGSATVSGANYVFHLEPDLRGQQLNASLNCFADRHFKAEGSFDLTGVLDGRGTAHELLGSTTGHLEMIVSDGRVYRDIILLNVLRFLNVTQVLTGAISAHTMEEKGLGFTQMHTRVEVQDGTLRLKEFSLDADEIILSATGKMDLLAKRVDCILLVAPQATLGAILGHIPLFGETLQTLTSIPLKLGGTFDDIHVLPLSPDAIGSQLKSALKQMAGIPMKVVHLDTYREAVKSGSR